MVQIGYDTPLIVQAPNPINTPGIERDGAPEPVRVAAKIAHRRSPVLTRPASPPWRSTSELGGR